MDDVLSRRLDVLVELALEEDLGALGDVSGRFFVGERERVVARVVARESGVLAGLEAARRCFLAVDETLELVPLAAEGDVLVAGDAVLEVRGLARSVLCGERSALNFLQRLSGIASQTRRCVLAVAGTDCRILDTRKTTPGWRLLEKAAVRAGGGVNHRMGLYDRVMVKDNHLMAMELEDLGARIGEFRRRHPGLLVELEADLLSQVELFLTLEGVDWILLDNMSDAQMARAVEMRDAAGARVLLEGSGNMCLERLPSAAATGVDGISLGALTHSVRALDLGLDIAAG